MTTPRTHRRRANSFGVTHAAVRRRMPQRRHASIAPAPDAAPSAKKRTSVARASWASAPAVATGREGRSESVHVVCDCGVLSDGAALASVLSLRGNHDDKDGSIVGTSDVHAFLAESTVEHVSSTKKASL